MKIDASPIMVPERDPNPKGARGDARDEGAGQAFGAAVRSAGEKAVGRKPGETETRGADKAKAEAANDDAAAEPDKESTEGEAILGGKSAALDLLTLMTALQKPDAPVEGEGDEEGAGKRAGAVPVAGAQDGDGAGETVQARFPRVQVLKTETHFEPRMEGAMLDDTPRTTPDGDRASPAKVVTADDLAARMAQQLQEPRAGDLFAAADPAKAAQRLRPASEATAETASSGAASGVPARFDEVVARLAQHGTSAEGQSGAGSRQEGRDGGRRSAERSESAVAGLRGEGRGDASVSKVGGDATDADAGTVPGLALQVASRIAYALGSAPASGAPTPREGPFQAAENAHLRMRAGGAALKTLTIQLQPEHLGTLEVSMRLREGKLAIELSASKPEAAAALTQDRDTLRKVLETAGFSIDDAALTVTTRDAPSLRASDAGSSGSGAGGGQSGSSFPSGSQSGRRDGTEGQNARTARPAAGEAEGTAHATPAGPASQLRPAGQTYL